MCLYYVSRLFELEEYLKSGDILDDATAKIEMVIKYLKALNSLFELRLLGKQVRVFKSDGPTLQQMEAGFNYRLGVKIQKKNNGKNSYVFLHINANKYW